MRLLAPLRPTDHVRGAADGSLTLIQYGDYECPYTRRSHEVVRAVLEAHPDVTFAFRHFPLRHLHPNAQLYALVAEAASRQERFWALHDRLMSHADELLPSLLLDDFEATEIDLPRLRADLDRVAARVEEYVQGGVQSGVHQTPTFFVDGELFQAPWQGLEPYIARRLRDRADEAGRTPGGAAP